MLRDLCSIFANFSSAPEFCLECARSGYYDAELVAKAGKTCRKLNLLTPENLESFESLAEKVDAASRDVEDFDELTKDAPDEFLDPLMCTYVSLNYWLQELNVWTHVCMYYSEAKHFAI